MAYNWESDTYKQAAAQRGGSFSTANGETSNVTWNEAIDPSKWQSGGHYVNPSTGTVQQWFESGNASAGNSSGLSGGTSANFDRMDRNANPGDAYFWDAADGWKLKDGGGSGLSLSQRPTVDLAGQYKSLYDSLGIQSYRDQMNDFTNQLNAMQEEMTNRLNSLQQERNDAAALINENPWSSAANRTGRLAKLDQQYQNKAALVQNEYATKLNTLQNTMNNVNNQYQMAMSDLDTQMNLYTQQYQFDLNNFDQNLAQLNTLLDRGALDNASLSDLSSLASQVGLSSSMLASMAQAAKNSRMNPTLLTNTDDYGNVTATLLDTNTGNIINQQVLQGVAASKVASGSGSGSSVSTINSLLNTREKLKKQGQDTTVIDNQLAAYGVYPDTKTGSSGSGLNEYEESALQAAYNLLNSDYNAITGLKNYGQMLLNNGQYSTTKAYYDSLINNLAIGKSAGLSGAKSDNDIKMIKASIPLNTNMSDTEFEKNLRQIIADLEAKKGGTSADIYLKNYDLYISSF